MPFGIVIDASGNVYTVNSGNSTVSKITPASPLPVTLLGFNGILQKGIANLEWQSGVEENLNRYELE